jgi:ADP-ribose pyrophosphatase YjhB (NUDIX family)
VGALVTRADGAVLLVRRAQPPYQDHWSLPGGQIQQGESPQVACAREVKEETGFIVEVGESLGLIKLTGRGGDGWDIEDFRAVITNDSPHEPIAGDDASEVGWFLMGELAELATTPQLAEYLRAWGVSSEVHQPVLLPAAKPSSSARLTH